MEVCNGDQKAAYEDKIKYITRIEPMPIDIEAALINGSIQSYTIGFVDAYICLLQGRGER